MQEKRKDRKGRNLRNGEVQRSDGKYMFRYTDALGERQTIYSWRLVSTDKLPEGKRECQALRDMEQEVFRDLQDDIHTADAKRITVDEMFQAMMRMRTDLKETTRYNYITLYRTHVQGPIGRRPIKTIKSPDVYKLYAEMFQQKHLAVSTVRSTHAVVYQIFERAVFECLIRQNPSTGIFSQVRKRLGTEPEKRKALTEKQQTQFIRTVYGTPAYSRWGPLFTVLLGTGMRIGEALGLRWCDCDFEANRISVNHTLLYKPCESTGQYEYRISSPKTDAGRRFVPMLEEVKAALLKLKDTQRGTHRAPFTVDGYTNFVFLNNKGRVFTPGAVFAALQNVTDAYNRKEAYEAEVENRAPDFLPKFSAHILRHTFCTRFCENETNLKVVQDIMGHKNFSTTMNVYSDATEVRKQASIHNLEGKMCIS